MIEISENVIMMSIQAIHYAIKNLSIERESVENSAQADYDEVIEAYEITASELRNVYEQALTEGYDLPPYTDLVD